jgi:hypothetical protein
VHFVGDHGAALASLASVDGFDVGIGGEQIGLFGNDTDDIQRRTVRKEIYSVSPTGY